MRINKLLECKPMDNNDKSPILMFDIDGTLYKEYPEVVEQIRKRCYDVLSAELGDMRYETFFDLCDEYNKTYGANFKGFISNYNLSKELINQMDDICGDVKDLIRVDKSEIDILKRCKHKKMVFTNSNMAQAVHLLDVIGISESIDTLFCASFKPNTEIISKPQVEAFEIVNNMINKENNRKVFFFDDNMRNIESANKVGWIGVFVTDADEIGRLVLKTLEKYGM